MESKDVLRLGVATVVAAGTVQLLRRLFRTSARPVAASARVIVAVSGTIQDGFELRKNIDYRADGEPTVEAVLIGYGVARGAKMYFDIKDEGCREFDSQVPHRVNPAVVLTGDKCDANQYALYLVDERACLNALLGEPRLLTMTPDALRIDLEDAKTSPEVRSFARAVIARDGKTETGQLAVLCVVSCYRSGHFVAAPPMEVRSDGTRLTSFRASLAKFSSMKDGLEPGTPEWNCTVAAALAEARMKKPLDVEPQAPRDVTLYATDKNTARLSRRMTAAEFNAIAAEAGMTLRAA